MKIHLPTDIQKKLILALEKAGAREIGGVLMGEHVDEAEFRIVDLTIQKQFGNVMFFLRLVRDAVGSLKKFFKQTGYNYKKFNYLGEWHSHPTFPPLPSLRDIKSMQEIVADSDTGANFAVLIIVQLNKSQEVDVTATVFLKDGRFFTCELIKEK